MPGPPLRLQTHKAHRWSLETRKLCLYFKSHSDSAFLGRKTAELRAAETQPLLQRQSSGKHGVQEAAAVAPARRAPPPTQAGKQRGRAAERERVNNMAAASVRARHGYVPSAASPSGGSWLSASVFPTLGHQLPAGFSAGQVSGHRLITWLPSGYLRVGRWD